MLVEVLQVVIASARRSSCQLKDKADKLPSFDLKTEIDWRDWLDPHYTARKRLVLGKSGNIRCLPTLDR